MGKSTSKYVNIIYLLNQVMISEEIRLVVIVMKDICGVDFHEPIRE